MIGNLEEKKYIDSILQIQISGEITEWDRRHALMILLMAILFTGEACSPAKALVGAFGFKKYLQYCPCADGMSCEAEEIRDYGIVSKCIYLCNNVHPNVLLNLE